MFAFEPPKLGAAVNLIFQTCWTVEVTRIVLPSAAPDTLSHEDHPYAERWWDKTLLSRQVRRQSCVLSGPCIKTPRVATHPEHGPQRAHSRGRVRGNAHLPSTHGESVATAGLQRGPCPGCWGGGLGTGPPLLCGQGALGRPSWYTIWWEVAAIACEQVPVSEFRLKWSRRNMNNLSWIWREMRGVLFFAVPRHMSVSGSFYSLSQMATGAILLCSGICI